MTTPLEGPRDASILRSYGSTALRGCPVGGLAVSRARQRAVITFSSSMIVHDLASGAWDGVFATAEEDGFLFVGGLPDGERYVVVTPVDLELCDFSSQEVVQSCTFEGGAMSALAAEGGHVAIATHESILIVGLPGCEVRKRVPIDTLPERIALSPDGERLALVEGSTVRLWDWKAERALWTHALDGQPEILAEPEFSRDGELLYVPTWYGVAILRVADGERIGALKHTGEDLPDRVTCARVSPNGKWLATAHERSGVVVLWDTTTHAPHGVVDVYGCHSPPLCFASDERLWIGAGCSLMLIDVTRVRELPVAPGLRGAARGVRAAGDVLLAHGDKSALDLFERSTAAHIRTLSLDARINACELDPTGSILAVAGDLTRLGAERDALEWFDCRSGEKLGEVTGLRAWSLAFAGPRLLISGDYDGTVRVHRLDVQAPPESIAQLGDGITELAASTDGTVVATRSFEGALSLVTLATGDVREIRSAEESSKPIGIAWATIDHAPRLVIADDQGNLSIFDGAGFVELGRVGEEPTVIAASGNLVAVGDAEGVALFDAAARQKLGGVTLQAQASNRPVALCFAADGSELVVATSGGTLVALSIDPLCQDA